MTEQEKAALVERLNLLAENLKWHNVHYAQDVLMAVDALTTPPAPVTPDGWRLVPVVPRIEQLISGRKSVNGTGKMSHLMHQRLSDIYRAMLAAAPEHGGES